MMSRFRSRRDSTIRPRLWPLLVLVYLIALTGLLGTLFADEADNAKPPEITSAQFLAGSPGSSMRLSGRDFHDDLRLIVLPDLIDDSAELWHTLSGTTVRAITIKDKLALVGTSDKKLLSIDLAAAKRPYVLDSIEVPQKINEIIIHENRAWLSLVRDGSVLVDISQPDDLQLLSASASDGTLVDADFSGQTAYFADLKAGIVSIDMSAARPEPRLLSRNEKPWRLTIDGSRLALATITGHIRIFDILSSGDLNEVGSLYFSNPKKGHVRGLAILQNTLLVALSDGSLKTYSLNDWPRLQPAADLLLPGNPYDLKLSQDRKRVAVSLVSAGVALIEMDASGSVAVSRYLRLPWTSTVMAYAGNKILLTRLHDPKGLFAFDTEKIPRKTERHAADLVDRNPYHFVNWNGRLYGYRRDGTVVLLRNSGQTGNIVEGPTLMMPEDDRIEVFEQTATGAIRRSDTLQRKQKVRDVARRDTDLLILHPERLEVLAQNEDGDLLPLANLPLSGQAEHMKLFRSDYLLVTTRFEGVKVIDLKDRQHPKLVSHIAPPEHLLSYSIARDVLVRNDIVYVSQGTGGIYVVDFSRPEEPKLLQIIDTPGIARNMVFHEDLLLVADSYEGIFLVDFTQPGKGVPVGSLPTPLVVSEISVVADGVLISHYPGGTMKLPLPIWFDTVPVSENSLDIPLAGTEGQAHYAFIYDEQSHQRLPLPRSGREEPAQK